MGERGLREHLYLIQLLHFTLATKQPAMTAPAMAAKLKDIDSSDATGAAEKINAFVDEVTHLVRSQVAAVLGNVFMVVPAVLLVNALIQLLLGHPMISAQEARHVLETLTLLGPTLLWAAFTGGILFAASLMRAGQKTGLCCTAWGRPCATTRALPRCWVPNALRAGRPSCAKTSRALPPILPWASCWA